MNSATLALALISLLQSSPAQAPQAQRFYFAPRTLELAPNSTFESPNGFAYRGASPFWSVQGAPTEQRGWLGVSLENADDGGIAITAVVPSSPAARAQLRSGDRLLSIGGTRVESYDALVEALKAHRPDEEIALVLERDVTVHLDEDHKDGERFLLGLYLAEAKDKDAKDKGAKDKSADTPTGDGQRGALVTRTSGGYPAASAGIANGDRLMSVDGKPVDSSDAVIAALADVDAPRDVTVRIARTRQVKLGSPQSGAPQLFGRPQSLGKPQTAPQPRARPAPVQPPTAESMPADLEEELRALSQELRELREQVSKLRSQIDRLKER